MYDAEDRIKPDKALPDVGVAVFGSAAFIFAVIDVENCDLVLSDQPVEAVEDAVKIIYDVVARIMDMAGIKAHPEAFRAADAVIDPGKLFKAFADFGAFSGHRFQRDADAGRLGEHFV